MGAFSFKAFETPLTKFFNNFIFTPLVKIISKYLSEVNFDKTALK